MRLFFLIPLLFRLPVGLVERVNMADDLDCQRYEYQPTLYLVVDRFELVVFVGVNIPDAQKSLNQIEVSVPLQQIRHQHHPLHIAQKDLPSTQIFVKQRSRPIQHNLTFVLC